MTREEFVKDFKVLFAAHHYAYISKDIDEIASVVNVSRRRLEGMIDTPEFLEALSLWNYNKPTGDFALAERVWTEIIQSIGGLSAVEYPDKPFKSSQNGSPETYALINSHLFCVDNLSDNQIRKHLAEERKFESEPVRYEGQALENRYYFWIYPNYDKGIYSKVFARANIVGDLVIGDGENTCLVCIRHDRLTLTRQVSNGTVNVSDERLLVCL